VILILKRTVLLSLCSSVVFCLAGSVGLAQESSIAPISTERPTVGPCTDVIPRNSLQIETGVGAALERNGYTADLPESLLRLGLTNRVEVRFLNSNLTYQRPTNPEVPTLQTADTAFSAKVLLDQPNRIGPRSAILSLSVPTGGVTQSSGSYDPTAAVVWAQSLPRGFSLDEVVQTTLTTLHGARRPQWSPSIAAGYALSGKISLFAEYAPNLFADRNLSYVVDGGFTYAHGKSQQFDVRVGYTTETDARSALISLGYSRRYDHFLWR